MRRHREYFGGLTPEEFREFSDKERQRLEEGAPPANLLNLPSRPYFLLRKSGVQTVEGIREVLRRPRLPFGIGPKTKNEIKEALDRYITEGKG